MRYSLLRLAGLAALLAWAVCVAEPASAQKRVALVIGNDAYSNLPKLQKAVNDARAVAASLRDIGFEVVEGENLTRRETNRKLADFEAALSPGDQAFFFFAGHGVAIGAENFLIPTDMPKPRPGEEGLVQDEAHAVNALIERVQGRGAASSFFVLDACRDNPFKASGVRSIGGTRGLTRVSAPTGVFVLFSAGIGQTALDRLGNADPDPNSVFTRKLVPLLHEPGLTHVRLAKQIQQEVAALARKVPHQQQPAYYDQIIGEIVLRPGPATETTADTKPDAEEDRLAALQSRLQELEERLKARSDPPREEPKVAVGVFPKQQVVDPPANDCDRLAANPEDPDKKADGVYGEDIKITPAITACRNALAAYPGTPRFHFQLGRALQMAKLYVEALEEFRAAADKGYVPAVYGVGFMYAEGQGVRQDDVEALRWVRKAAATGYGPALNHLAIAYANGRGVAKDEAEALRWYRKAVEKGNPYAMYTLGKRFMDGDGVAKDELEGVRLMRQAAGEGHTGAMNYVGYVYANGRGVAKDELEGLRWYRKAAEKGNMHAQYNLGRRYIAGEGVTKDLSEGYRWVRQAAEKGHSEAMTHVGYALAHGSGVAKDEAEAVRWYRKAVEKDEPWAINNLGSMYKNGNGVAKDDAEAVRLYRRSADKGNETAMNNLALMYAEGRGVAKDMTEAERWYRKAAEKGVAGAMVSLGNIYARGEGGRAKDYREAVAWYRKAADKGDNMGVQNLGSMYAFGWGVQRDERQAAQLVFKALRAGNDFSLDQMTSKASNWGPEFRREMQRLLKEAGFYRGSIDGQFGGATAEALRALHRSGAKK